MTIADPPTEARELLDAARSLFATLDTAAADLPDGASVPRSSLDAITEAGLYGVMVPRAVGGRELPLADLAEVYAEVARADGSTGWVYFASDLTAAYFGAYLPDDGVAEVFADGPPLMAGQFAPNGTGRGEGDDWVVSGDYQFGSGIELARWAGGGMVTSPEDGGESGYRFACFPAASAELLGNWDVLGLRATASVDYRIRDLRVPDRHTFDFFSPEVRRGGPMYRLGILALAAAGHAGWALGVTRRALDELAVLAPTTRMGAAGRLLDSDHFLVEYGRLESEYLAGRAWVRAVLAEAEAAADRDGGIDEATANLVRQAGVHVNRGGAAIAQQAYLLAGTRALREGPLQRCFRDLHAGSQHFFASTGTTIEFARSRLDTGRT